MDKIYVKIDIYLIVEILKCMISYYERLASHVLFFGIFVVCILNLELFLGISIPRLILPSAYIAYLLIILLIKFLMNQRVEKNDVLIVIILPVLFLIGSFLLAHTYDFTFDGENYHQTAVISLTNGWNPIRDAQLVIPAPVGLYGISGEFSKPYVAGYPKALWLIQSSIYTLTGHINSAVVTNLIVGLLAFIFLSSLLLRLGG